MSKCRQLEDVDWMLDLKENITILEKMEALNKKALKEEE